MTRPFAPKHVLRHIPLPLIGRMISSFNGGAKPSRKLDPENLAEVTQIVDGLPQKQRGELEAALLEIHQLADEDGVRVLIEEVQEREPEQVDSLVDVEGLYAQAALCHLDFPKAFQAALVFRWADTLSQRSWKRRIDLPRKQPAMDAASLERFGKALSAYYGEREGRGWRCTVEHYLRGENDHYYFAYPDDYSREIAQHDEGGNFRRTTHRPTFEIVYVYNKAGSLDIYAKGGAKVAGRLELLFGQHILREAIKAKDANRPPYHIQGMINRRFEFETDPEDGIEEVRVRRLRLSVVGSPKRRITLEASPDGNRDDVYEMLHNYLDKNRLPLAMLKVAQAMIQIKLDRVGTREPKTLTFDISYPDSCSLKSKPESMRLLGEKYLKRWKIDREQ